jgi:tetratricopeptide (TPR) repeat protein
MYYCAMTRRWAFVWCVLLACGLGGCTIEVGEWALIQGISLDGRPLIYNPPAEERRELLLDDVVAAEQVLDADPANEEAIIWYGRRVAYYGDFRDAIEIYRAGLDFLPDSFRIRRHLGHRLITVRELDRAIAVLTRAGELIEGVPDEVEPDGQPNALNLPRSTTHFNLWYHLALAKYLKRDFAGAAEGWQRCLDVSTNDDSIVAASYWLVLSLLRQGDGEGAARILASIRDEMDVIENHAYHELLLMFQEKREAEELLEAAEVVDLDLATVGYGVGMKRFLEGDMEGARALWRRVIEETNWAAFGHIAAEAELAAVEMAEQR